MAFRRVAVATVVCATLSATHTSLLAKFIPGGLWHSNARTSFNKTLRGNERRLPKLSLHIFYKNTIKIIIKKKLGELNCKKCLPLCINYSQGTTWYNTTQWLSTDRKACSLKFFDVSFFLFLKLHHLSVLSARLSWHHLGEIWQGERGLCNKGSSVHTEILRDSKQLSCIVSLDAMRPLRFVFFPCHCTA